MSRVIVGSQTISDLQGLSHHMVLFDENGEELGSFSPTEKRYRDFVRSLMSEVSDEELQRCRQAGPGRPLNEILSQLERG